MPASTMKPQHTSRRVRRTPALSDSSDTTKGARHVRHTGHGKFYKPGDPVRESGIYEVFHDQGHRGAHEVVMIAEDHFPDCDTCMDRVRFRLVRTAPYIFQDADFEEPEN